MFETYPINWLAVLFATLASFIIGWLWYSNILFGKVWMRLSGITSKKQSNSKNSGMAKPMMISLILGLIASFVLANLIYWLNVSDSLSALRISLWLWLGFFVPVEANKVLWEGKPWGLYFIGVFHHLAALSVSAIILSNWM